jgi:hypothetical protein
VSEPELPRWAPLAAVGYMAVTLVVYGAEGDDD